MSHQPTLAWRGGIGRPIAATLFMFIGHSAATAEVTNCWQSGSELAQCAATWERVSRHGDKLGNPRTGWEAGSFESFVIGVSRNARQSAWCPTAPMGTDTLFASVAKYLREHSEEWGKTPETLVLAPLSAAFPCTR